MEVINVKNGDFIIIGINVLVIDIISCVVECVGIVNIGYILIYIVFNIVVGVVI